VVRVTNQEDTLDGIEGGSCQARQSVNGGGRTLRVAFKNDALGGVAAEEGGDLVDDLLKGW
jgi:hypothetical protein